MDQWINDLHQTAVSMSEKDSPLCWLPAVHSLYCLCACEYLHVYFCWYEQNSDLNCQIILCLVFEIAEDKGVAPED